LDAGVSDPCSSGMSTHLNKVHHVTTLAKLAKDLGEDEDWLWASPARWRSKVASCGLWCRRKSTLAPPSSESTLRELAKFYKETPELLRQ